MNKHLLEGFKVELEKQGSALEDGAKGLGVGALLGAAISAMGMNTLEKLIRRNKDVAIVTGALMGAGVLGGTGYALGSIKDVIAAGRVPPPVPPAPLSGDVTSGPPPAGTPISSMRHI